MSPEEEKAIRRMIQRKFHELGPMTFNEIVVLFCFTILVLLWFFRSPGFMVGWGDLLVKSFDLDV